MNTTAHRICVPLGHYIALYRIASSAVVASRHPKMPDDVAAAMLAELSLRPGDHRHGCLVEEVEYARRRIERSLSR